MCVLSALRPFKESQSHPLEVWRSAGGLAGSGAAGQRGGGAGLG
jgi:hypothetical protein